MSLRFPCSRCGARLTAPESAAGTILPCPKCGNRILCPEEAEPSAPGPAVHPPEPARWYHSWKAVFWVICLANILAFCITSCVGALLYELFKAPFRSLVR